jgi:hypothetical protein
MPLLQAFPFPSTLEEVTLHQLSQAGVFIYSWHGKWVFPPSCGVFLPLPLLQAFLLLITGRVPLLLPSPAGLFIYSSRGKWSSPPSCGVFLPPLLYKLFCSWLLGVCHCSCLLQPACEGFPLPPPLALRVSCCLCHMSFLLLLLSIQFLFFSLGGGWSVQGAMLIWPRIVCGSTMFHLAHLVVRVFPSHLGAGVWWQHGSLPGFSV